MKVTFRDPLPERGDQTWRQHKACAGLPTENFFPGKGNMKGLVRRAQAVCEDCPVKMECLNYAKVHQIDFGIWGGVDMRPKDGRSKKK